MSAKLKLLLVDDEPLMLDGLSRSLRGSFELRRAACGEDGLALLAAEPDVAIVMSDMRMPLMSGAAFLARVRETTPDTVRLLLTGQAEIEDAIAAINEGSIFRFLRKPCAPEVMRATLAAASDQYRLVMAERQLLEQTLRGAVKALCDALALANPQVFGASTRVKRTASLLAAKLGVTETWPLEVAAMVCQLGAIALPPGLYERRADTEALSHVEREMLERVPVVTEQLLAPIPRLEPVRDILRFAYTAPSATGDAAAGAPSAGPVLAGRILRAALDFEELEATSSATSAVETLCARGYLYDPRVLEALAHLFDKPEVVGVEIRIPQLREGMVIAADIMSKSGVLIVARGHSVTPSLVERLRNFVAALDSDRVKIVPT